MHFTRSIALVSSMIAAAIALSIPGPRSIGDANLSGKTSSEGAIQVAEIGRGAGVNND